MTLTARQSAGLVTGSAVAAASTLLISIIAARSTGDEAAFKEFTVYWSLFFAAVGVLTGVQQEATRATARPERRTGARLAVVAALVGGMAAVAVGGVLVVVRDRLLPLSGPPALAVLTVGVAVMSLYQTFVGCAAGHRRWWSVTALITVDAVTRVVLTVAAAVLLGSLVGLQWAIVLAALSWVPFLFSPHHRRLFAGRGDAGIMTLLHNSVWTLLSAAALAALTTGFPALVQLSAPEVDPRRLAIVMTVVTVTRSALLLPLQAFQGVLLARFADVSPARLPRELRRLALIVAGLVVVALVPAWLLGPPAIAALYGAVYTPGPVLVAGLWVAAAPLAWLLVTGQAALSQSLHRWYAAGWVLAGFVTVGIMLAPTPAPVEIRVVTALGLGPLTGMAMHLAGITRRRPDAAAPHPRFDTPR